LRGLRLHDSTNHPVDCAYTDQRATKSPFWRAGDSFFFGEKKWTNRLFLFSFFVSFVF
jgi:hypothetical protein